MAAKRYKVELLPAAARDMRKLPAEAGNRIIRAMYALADDPRPPGVVKLAGTDKLWRLRIGDYRLIYEIQDNRLVVLVVRVGHRRDVYRQG